jgi:5-methylcytosine-specific restriction endonuclease McrA
MEYLILLIGVLIAIKLVLNRWVFSRNRGLRRDYYRNEYLKSDEWRRKRYVVLKRDNWHCVYCGAPATQVHHKRYAKYNIGREPIGWLVSVCDYCHESRHS